MQQILSDRSVRFFPGWNHKDVTQVIGLIQLVNYILKENPQAYHWIEIGSYIGESATIFLGFDSIHKLECVEISESRSEMLRDKFLNEIKSNRCCIHTGNSHDYAAKFEDNSIDVIYIDADHSYKSVKKDIELYYPKLKIGGYLCGHDYIEHNPSYPGVYIAVQEFIKSINYSNNIMTFQDQSWLIRKEKL